MNHLHHRIRCEACRSIPWRIARLSLTAMLALLAWGWGTGGALAVDPPGPSDAEPGDKIEGPALEPATESAAPQGEAAAEPAADGVEVLTRGPVHEAFAETVSFDPQPGVVVPKAPPEAVEELPPDQKPDGDNVAWIPGYWAWDDERDDYLWVSGIWRLMPPDRQWVSGYWRETNGGYQWVSGYWADAAAAEVEYLPEAPPATLDVGPNVAAPLPDQTWIPGTWMWRETRYVWQPGYWIAPQLNWVWVPAHYVWAPGGFIFVGGYWDYVPMSRGVLFAPIYFTAGVYTRPGFFYSPAAVINLAIFGDQLFCRPHYHHYYFGDYYAANYLGAGFYPWFSLHQHHGYDPIWTHQRWHHRNDHDWARHVEAKYQHRRDHEEDRPARTLTAEKALMAKAGASPDKPVPVVTSLDGMARSKDAALRLKSLDKEERQKLAARQKELQTFRQERQKVEAATKVTATKRAAKATLPKPPIAAQSTGQLAKELVPPTKPRSARSDATLDSKAAATQGADLIAPKSRTKTTSRSGLATESTPGVQGADESKKQLPGRRGLAAEAKSKGESSGEQTTPPMPTTRANRRRGVSSSSSRATSEAASQPQATPSQKGLVEQKAGTPSRIDQTPPSSPSGLPLGTSDPLKTRVKSGVNRAPSNKVVVPPTGPALGTKSGATSPPEMKRSLQPPSQRQFRAGGQTSRTAPANPPSTSLPKVQQTPPPKQDKPPSDKDKDKNKNRRGP